MYFNSNRLRMELGNSDYRIIEIYGEPTLIKQEFKGKLLIKETKYSLKNELISTYLYKHKKNAINITIYDKYNNLLEKLFCNQTDNILTVYSNDKTVELKYKYHNDFYFYENIDYNWRVKYDEINHTIYQELLNNIEKNGGLYYYKSEDIVKKSDFSYTHTKYNEVGSLLFRDTYNIGKYKIFQFHEDNLSQTKHVTYNYHSSGVLLNIITKVKDINGEETYSIEKINDEENIDVLEKDKLKRDNSNWFMLIKNKIKNTLRGLFYKIISVIIFLLAIVFTIGLSFLDEIKDYYLWDEYNIISVFIDSNKDLDTELKEIYEVFNSEEKYSIDDLKSEYIENEKDNSKRNVKISYIEFLNNRDIILKKMGECGDSIVKYKLNGTKSKDYYFRYSKLILDILIETTKQMEKINIKNIKLINKLIDYNISDNTSLYAEYDILLLNYNFYIYLHKFYNVERDFILANLDSFKFENNIIFPTVPKLKVELDDLNADFKNMRLILINRMIKVQEFYDQ